MIAVIAPVHKMMNCTEIGDKTSVRVSCIHYTTIPATLQHSHAPSPVFESRTGKPKGQSMGNSQKGSAVFREKEMIVIICRSRRC